MAREPLPLPSLLVMSFPRRQISFSVSPGTSSALQGREAGLDKALGGYKSVY